jgi:hypothetical protein
MITRQQAKALSESAKATGPEEQTVAETLSVTKQPSEASEPKHIDTSTTQASSLGKHTMPNADLIFQSQINSIAPFTGAAAQDAERWLTHAFNVLQVQGFTDNNEVKHLLSGFLDGDALDWYQEHKLMLCGWMEFRAAFLQRFPSAPLIRNPFEHFQQLSTRRQGLTESSVDYYTSVLKLCHSYNQHMSDIERVNHLKKGLRPSLLEKVLEQEPTTPDDFIAVVFKAESNQRILQRQYDTTSTTDINVNRDHQRPDEPPHVTPVFSSRQQYNTPSHQPQRAPGQFPRRRPGHDGGVICYSCGQPGHIAPRCPLNWQ